MSKLTPIFKGSSGLNTTQHPLRAPFDSEKGVMGLSAAVNVVVDDSGMITRREGYVEVDDGSWHSLFCAGEPCLGVRGTDLCLLDADLNYTVLRSGMTNKVSYVKVNRDVYYTSKAGFGIVREGLHVDWEAQPYVGPDTNRDFVGPFNAEHIAFFMGRIWLSSEDFLVASEPFAWSWFDLHGCGIPLDSRIRMLAPLKTGMFVSTSNKIYFLKGKSFDDLSLEEVYEYPAIEGTVSIGTVEAIRLGFQEPGGCIIFATSKGVCLGHPFGFVVNLTEENIVYPETAQFGAGLLSNYNYVHTTGV